MWRMARVWKKHASQRFATWWSMKRSLSMMTPRSLMRSVNGTMVPATSTAEKAGRETARLSVPRRIASDLSGLRARPSSVNQACSARRHCSRLERLADSDGRSCWADDTGKTVLNRKLAILDSNSSRRASSTAVVQPFHRDRACECVDKVKDSHVHLHRRTTI